MKHVKGPDFPTGAIIVGRSGIRDAYRTGRGRIVMRARAHIEELRGGKSAIIVTELPYGVKKGGDNGVIKKIADLVNDKVLTEISDLADHSRPLRHADPDRAEARRDPAGRAEQALQAHARCRRRSATTPSRSSTACRARSRCSSWSRTTSTSSARSSRAGRSTSCARREKRAHILQGYLIALDNLDAVIALIRAARRHRGGAHRPDGDSSSSPRSRRPRSSSCGSRASPALERKEVEDEYTDLQERIGELRALLGDEAKIDALIKEELLELKDDLRPERRPPHARSSPPRRSSSSRT